jgi:hypothetical protein
LTRVLSTLVATSAEAGNCGGTVFATPFKRSKPVSASCGHIGTTNDATVTYNWDVATGSSGKACVEGLGHERLAGPDTYGHAPIVDKWYSLGCGTSGGAELPWGYVAAVPQVRAQSENVPLGTYVDWRN